MTHTFSPIRIAVTRTVTESEHLVDAAVVSVDSVETAFGDAERPVIPRSALKPIQVIPLVASGAAAAFSFSPEDIALAAASHSAEVMHLDRTAEMLRRIGLDERSLECGATRPLAIDEADRLLRSGESFQRIHNCCSGKHAGFLAIAQHVGIDPTGYIGAAHHVQQLVTNAVEMFTGVDLSSQTHGIDGCGIPTHTVPLHLLARSMAHLVRAKDVAHIDDVMTRAAETVVAALAPNPRWMSGAGRVEVLFAEAATEPLICKIGAEGVVVAALPDRGLGIAVKARDGARRAGDIAMESILIDLGALRERDAVHTVVNAESTVVGSMHASWS